MDVQSDKMTQLEKLKKQKEILDARIQQAESRFKVKERKEDTRRKILIGAFMMEKLKKEEKFDSMIDELNGFLINSWGIVYLNSNLDLIKLDFISLFNVSIYKLVFLKISITFK